MNNEDIRNITDHTYMLFCMLWCILCIEYDPILCCCIIMCFWCWLGINNMYFTMNADKMIMYRIAVYMLMLGAMFTHLVFCRCYWWCLANICISYIELVYIETHIRIIILRIWQEVILSVAQVLFYVILMLICLSMLHISLFMMLVIMPITTILQACIYIIWMHYRSY